jgi:hypothetical protein
MSTGCLLFQGNASGEGRGGQRQVFLLMLHILGKGPLPTRDMRLIFLALFRPLPQSNALPSLPELLCFSKPKLAFAVHPR